MKSKVFKNKYEKEAFLKAFSLYFVSITILVLVIFYFHYKSLLLEQKQLLFLEMKNFALTFEGEKFKLDLVPLKKGQKLPYYEHT
jgi:two-component system OmpR family sensor kinase